MLGSVVEAEDVAQEALLRLTEQGARPTWPGRRVIPLRASSSVS
jgi:DNA-directed RNA polymerase specialized sigma24 family protein